MPLLTGNNKNGLAVPQDMISLFELNLFSAFFVLQCCLRAFPASVMRLRVWQFYFFVIFSSCEIKVTDEWYNGNKCYLCLSGRKKALNPSSYSFVKLFEFFFFFLMIGGFCFSSLLSQSASLPAVMFSSHLRNSVSQGSWGWGCCEYGVLGLCGRGWRLQRSPVAPGGWLWAAAQLWRKLSALWATGMCWF